MHFNDNETLHNPGLGPNNQFSCIETIPDSVMWPQSSVLLWRILTALYCRKSYPKVFSRDSDLTLILYPGAFFGTWHDFVSLIMQR